MIWPFKRTPVEPWVPPPPPEAPKPECKHLNSTVGIQNRIWCGSCQECGEEVNIAIILNNWLTELKSTKGLA